MVTGEIVNTDWSSDSYEASRSTELDLHLIIDRDGLRYLVFDNAARTVLKVGYFALVHQGFDWLQNALGSLKTQNGFKSVRCSIASLPFAIIPERFFEESLAPRYLELSFGREFSTTKHHHFASGMTLISEDQSEWKNAVTKAFPNTRFDTLIQEMQNFAASKKPGNQSVLAAHVSDSFMELCINGSTGLLFAGTFETRSAEDILYFIGLSARENQLNFLEDAFVISGADDATLKLLKNYFKHIEVPATSSKTELARGANTDTERLCQPFFFREL